MTDFTEANVSNSVQGIQVFHPGLTYSILELINELSVTKKDPVGVLSRNDQLYYKLREQVRTFTSFRDLESVFYLSLKRQVSILTVNDTEVLATLKLFWLRLQYLTLRLVRCGFVNLCDLGLKDNDLAFYRELLVRHALCCTFQENTEIIYLSCVLVGAHFIAECSKHYWGDLTDYEKLGIEKYIIHVVSKFDADDLRINVPGAGGRHLESSYQTQFIIQANLFANRKIQAEFLALAYFASGRQYITGYLDLLVDSELLWGVELLRDSTDLLDHVKRFEKGERYSHLGLKDYRVLDCVQSRDYFKTIKRIEKAYMQLTPEQLSKVITAIFSADFEKVDFYKVETPDLNQKVIFK